MAGRTKNKDGCIRQLPTGTWRGQVMDGYQMGGKRNIVSFSGLTQAIVETQIKDYWQKRDGGAIASQCITFAAWADIWYADYQHQVQPSTYAGYRFTLKILKDYFQKRKLQEMRPLEISRFFDFLRSTGYSKSYLTKCRSMLIQIFDMAEANELVSSNPARKVQTKRLFHWTDDLSATTRDAFSESEVETLRQKLRDDLLGNSILLMLGTGMRTQEILALSPDDIREDGSAVSVNRAIKMVAGRPELGPPKSARGRRVIPVPENYRRHALYLRWYGGKQHIWTSQRESGLYDVGVFRKQYYRALEEIPNVRKLSPHSCRHTYISLLEKHGVPMEQIARLAGHSRISTTDGYLHTDYETLVKATACLNK